MSNNNTAVDQKVLEATSASYYFDSYSHFGIHEEMLKDEVRTKSYMFAIRDNKHLFKDKIVLDVGCGTGILSMFAAQAGAKMVIGIECSEIIEQAKQIVKDNGFEQVITLIRGKVEEVVLPVPKVDIIISEWMGYFLLYESMLDTVLFARDKWLSEGGMVFPDKSTIYLGAIEDGQYYDEKINFWDDVYGFNFGCIKKIALCEPLVDTVNPDQVNTNYAPVMKLDAMTVKKEELAFESTFQLRAKRNDYVHAIIGHFDIGFTLGTKPVTFSTGPHAKYTHWKQTVFYLQEGICIEKGEVINGKIKCRPNEKNHRDLDIELTVDFDGAQSKYHKSHFYRLR